MGTVNSTLAAGPWDGFKTVWASFEFNPQCNSSRGCTHVFKGVVYHERNYFTKSDVVIKKQHRIAKLGDWKLYIYRCTTGQHLASKFKRHLQNNHNISQYKVRFVKPIEAIIDVWSSFTASVARFLKFKLGKDEALLIEERLRGKFVTFVTDCGSGINREIAVLAAFAHFTYHESGGELVVCNLQGVEDQCVFTLTNPVIHSKDGNYGDTDRGADGIDEFFQHHVCTVLCSNLSRPSGDYTELISNQELPPPYEELFPDGPPPVP
ncbi:alpha-protein kinase vwkA-like [Dreissena polymorpha]|uniref:Alpha-type protein kinase domain-containing protein n=1 Tax=Dreissena polymorpha TaxID=45954 RepID=A0A9D4E7R3_DREPO|nr:alpha-protein kinase vwkA-like [Dreissena polymorpha]KAH3774683.1 hypothetical protein DPMN_176070 [Dreissena polymorpha]